jgi:peptide/nickel transport system permease protein
MIPFANTAIRLLLTLWLAVTLAFFALRILPGDVITAQMEGIGATDEQIAARRAALGLDRPVGEQYAEYIGGLLRGDLGESMLTGLSVAEMIASQFGSTLALACGAMIAAVTFGVLSGMAAALGSRPVRWIARTLITLALAAPTYWTATLAIYLVAVEWRLLPSTSEGNSVRALILPCLVLGYSISGSIARVTSARIGEIRHADHIRTARGKGLRERRIVSAHMLRPVIAPILSVIALQFGFLLGGTVITEMIFARRGVGRVLLDAALNRDYTVVQGVVVLSAVVYMLVNTAADRIAVRIDPRLRG